MSYTYDANGLRVSKTVNGVKTYYQYSGNKLLYQETGNQRLYFWYDAFGNLCEICLFDETREDAYYVTCNSKGDVDTIYNYSGIVAKYNYDSWGNTVSVTDSNGNEITDSNHIGNINPIRYRGYYYDTESDLFYLQSRYYNPTIGRFLNADVYCDTGASFLGTNMFAYCYNNPVMCFDPTGEFGEEILAFIIAETTYFLCEVLLAVLIVSCVLIPFVSMNTESIDFYVPSLAELADQAVREKIAKGKASNVLYWEAYRIGDIVVLGESISKEKAILRVLCGEDVFAVSGQSAYWLAWEAGGYTIPIGPEFDKGKKYTLGYYEHYHTSKRNGAHVFFI